MRIELTLDCADPDALAPFWCGALGYQVISRGPRYTTLGPSETSSRGIDVPLVLARVPEPKTAKLRMHLDLYSDDVEGEVVRLEALGATRVALDPAHESGVVEEDGERWIVMADPVGNEFCVCQAGAEAATP